MAALLLDVGPDDEVILPSFTFSSTANAFLLRGAKLVFADVSADTMNLDVAHVEQLVSDRTRVIVPVHYAGVGCDMDRIGELAATVGARVVEDAAQAVDARYRGRFLGTIGDLGTFSFHETKNFVAGEGGALVINDPALVARAEIIREKGTNRNQFLRGHVDKYTWTDIGSSFIPSDLLAAVLLSQLEAMDEISRIRREVYERYRLALEPLAGAGHLALPRIPDDCESNHHAFFLRVTDEQTRDRLLGYLNENAIGAVFHYIPLHTAPVGRSLGYRSGMLPVTERESACLVRLPLHARMTVAQAEATAALIARFFAGRRGA